MHDLERDAPALLVNGGGDPVPSDDLLRTVDAWHLRIAMALHADRGGLGYDQPRGRALSIIFCA
jgi:hypothetical protein